VHVKLFPTVSREEVFRNGHGGHANECGLDVLTTGLGVFPGLVIESKTPLLLQPLDDLLVGKLLKERRSPDIGGVKG
jgi:hypothetical protein